MQVRTMLAAVATAAMLVLATAANAYAADGKQRATDASGPSGSRTWYCTSGSANAVACFAPRGEWFKIKDTWADGHPVVIEWRFYDDEASPIAGLARSGRIWNTSGKAAGWRYKNKSFPENQYPGGTHKYVNFRACSGHYGYDDIYENTCSAWRYDVRT